MEIFTVVNIAYQALSKSTSENQEHVLQYKRARQIFSTKISQIYGGVLSSTGCKADMKSNISSVNLL